MNDEDKAQKESVPECFIIMPIADGDEYEPGHFLKVYEDLISPACTIAGYNPIRADLVKQTNLIHLDILQKILNTPMAICDLSSANPNVMFELGLRQAFDKPTVLIQEIGSRQIFDIAPLRYTEYDGKLIYRDVLKSQKAIAESIEATRRAFIDGKGINSIVKILSLSSPAAMQDVKVDEVNPVLQLVRAEMNALRADVNRSISSIDHTKPLAFQHDIADFGRSLQFIKNFIWTIDQEFRTNEVTKKMFDSVLEMKFKLASFIAMTSHNEYTEDARTTMMQIDSILNAQKSLPPKLRSN